MVGANKISEFAKALEENCHQGDYETAWNGARKAASYASGVRR